MKNQVRDNYEIVEKNCCSIYQKNKEFLNQRFKDEKEFINYVLECCNQYYYLENIHLPKFKNWEQVEDFAKKTGLYVYFDDEVCDINYGHLCVTIYNENNNFKLCKNCDIFEDSTLGLIGTFDMEEFKFID